MKKTLLALIIGISLFGCAAPRKNPQWEAYKAYTSAHEPLARRGDMKWSDFYAQAYQHTLPLQSPIQPTLLEVTSQMISHAQDFEAGKITKEQLDQYRREAEITVYKTAREIEAGAQQRRAANDAASAAQLEAAARLMQNSGPRPLGPVNFPTTTNCRSVRQGVGVVQTTCY